MCVFGRVSCLVGHLRHMPCRTTRKCKETLLQVRERLTREQANRTRKRIKELLDTKDLSSDSDSEEEQDSSSDVSSDTLSPSRRARLVSRSALFVASNSPTYQLGSYHYTEKLS